MITIKDVEHVAKLARLELTEEEKEKFTHQLGDVLAHVEKMNEVDIKTRASFSKSVNSKPVESVETAGSLAYINPFNYFATNSYDTFDSSNPFIFDIGTYIIFST